MPGALLSSTRVCAGLRKRVDGSDASAWDTNKPALRRRGRLSLPLLARRWRASSANVSVVPRGNGLTSGSFQLQLLLHHCSRDIPQFQTHSSH